MKYRSSVLIFAKALLTDAACKQDGIIEDVKRAMEFEKKSFRDVLLEQLESKKYECTSLACKAIPKDDWNDIIDYVSRHHDAYGFRAVSYGNYRTPSLLLPWLASVAISALDDIGR